MLGDIDMAKERASECAMRLSQQPKKGIIFEAWFEILQGFVKAGNCLIDDVYGTHKIDSVTLENNSKGQQAGIVFKSKR